MENDTNQVTEEVTNEVQETLPEIVNLDNLSDEDFSKQQPSFEPVETTSEETTEEKPQEEVQQQPSQEVEQEEQASQENVENEEYSQEELQAALAAYKEIFKKPFRANGREMSVKDAQEVIQLMQMGAGFNKKMESINKRLPLLKTLENHGIKSVDDVRLLLDLKDKKPEAIAKFLSDSGIDLYDLDLESAKNYVPQAEVVSPQQVAIESVLESIQGTPNYEKTVNILGNQWDEASQEIISKNPQVIQIIHDQVNEGIYDAINAEVERQRMFGGLQGMSDIEAYYAVGNMLYPQNPQQQQVQQPPQQQQQAQQMQQQQRRSSVVAGTKQKSAGQPVDITTLTPEQLANMSDEEFLSIQAKKQYI